MFSAETGAAWCSLFEVDVKAKLGNSLVIHIKPLEIYLSRPLVSNQHLILLGCD